MRPTPVLMAAGLFAAGGAALAGVFAVAPVVRSVRSLLGGAPPGGGRDVFFTKNTTVNTGGFLYATAGFASENDAGHHKLPSSPTVTLVDGGRIERDLGAYNRSAVLIRGGSLGGGLLLRNNSAATISGGSVGTNGDAYDSLDVCDSAMVTMTGGHIGHNLRAHGDSTVNWSGGTLGAALYGGRVYLDGNATLNLFGTGLSRTQIKSDEGDGHLYRLSGRLADGSSLDGNLLLINNGSTVHVNLLAPGAVAPVLPPPPDPDAAVFFPRDAVIRAAVSRPVHVGYADQNSFEGRTRPTSPTVRLVAGGGITSRGGLDVYNHSTLDVSGGTIAGSVMALGHSTVNVTGGTLAGNLSCDEDSTVNISGGHFAALILGGRAALNLFGAGLGKTLVDANYGMYSRYTLSGALRDGTRLDGVQLLVVNGGKRRLVLHNAPAVTSRRA